MFRCRFIAAAMLAVAAVGLTACGGGGDSGSSSSAQKGATVLTWWDSWDYSPESKNAALRMIGAYEKSHPGVTIKRTALGLGDFRTKLVQAMATGKMPDVALIDNVDLAIYAAQGGLTDLTSYIDKWPDKSKYTSTMLRGYQGKYYGVPIRAQTLALYYNKTQFKAAGIANPPRNWAELRQDAKALTNADRDGLCFSAVAQGEGDFNFLPFLWQAGGDLKTVGDAASVKALTFLNQLATVDKSVPRAVLNWHEGDAGDRFMAGGCAMMINGPWQLPLFAGHKIDWGITTLPSDVKSASVLLGEYIVAGKGADPAQAWDLIRWVQDPVNLTKQTISELGLLPQRSDEDADPKFVYSPAVKVFAEQMKVARPREFGPQYGQAAPHVIGMMQDVIAGTKSPAAAAASAAPQIKPLIQVP